MSGVILKYFHNNGKLKGLVARIKDEKKKKTVICKFWSCRSVPPCQPGIITRPGLISCLVEIFDPVLTPLKTNYPPAGFT